ncbi:hypothetical protein Bbelb_313750 [Branchiostoma belcheri]|nr:hypothetical protein Bbelb_313750 [Branchiostoma belcheri]
MAVGNTQVDGMSTKLLVLSIVIPLTASFALAPDMVFMRYLTGTLEVPILTTLLYQDLVALKFVKAYISTTIRMFAIPITLMLDHFFMQKIPNSFHLAGVVLVMFGIVFVSAHTWWKECQKKLRIEPYPNVPV